MPLALELSPVAVAWIAVGVAVGAGRGGVRPIGVTQDASRGSVIAVGFGGRARRGGVLLRSQRWLYWPVAAALWPFALLLNPGCRGAVWPLALELLAGRGGVIAVGIAGGAPVAVALEPLALLILPVAVALFRHSHCCARPSRWRSCRWRCCRSPVAVALSPWALAWKPI